ncbi:MAG: M1 family metallopeptidase [Pyrinomonadaceae bacterium]
MNRSTRHFYRAFLLGCFAMATVCLGAPSIDAIKYDARIEPDLATKTLSGRVTVEFRSLTAGQAQIEFNDGDLIIDEVQDRHSRPLTFVQDGKVLRINLARKLSMNQTDRVTIAFHGTAKYGMQFYPAEKQVYTAFSTSQWMPCLDAPSDRTQFKLAVVVRSGLKVVGNGTNTETRQLPDGKVLSVWEQKVPVPTYIFGFAAGDFREVTLTHRGVMLRFLVPPGFTADQTGKIFRDTADELDFFEERSGVKYPYRTYTQVLAAGGTQQEMAGFTVLDEPYGRGVLADERENWLGAHEFAHQWWGNQVTNVDWTHFWLNEGLATFMVAAYKEHRFGRDEYLKEVGKFRTRYEKVRDAGKDKPLVFPDWDHPTREDRTIVYQKGALVLYLLREEMGDRAFWTGLKAYTRAFWGKSVTTVDFQRALEKAAKRNLQVFFDKWVYGRAI